MIGTIFRSSFLRRTGNRDAGQKGEAGPIKPEIIRELNQIGIKSPAAQRLAVLKWVTVEYIREIVHQLNQIGKENQTGLIIHKIKSPDKVKEIKSSKEYYLNDGYICDKCYTKPCTCRIE